MAATRGGVLLTGSSASSLRPPRRSGRPGTGSATEESHNGGENDVGRPCRWRPAQPEDCRPAAAHIDNTLGLTTASTRAVTKAQPGPIEVMDVSQPGVWAERLRGEPPVEAEHDQRSTVTMRRCGARVAAGWPRSRALEMATETGGGPRADCPADQEGHRGPDAASGCAA